MLAGFVQTAMDRRNHFYALLRQDKRHARQFVLNTLQGQRNNGGHDL
jgi:hypothetical protein